MKACKTAGPPLAAASDWIAQAMALLVPLAEMEGVPPVAKALKFTVASETGAGVMTALEMKNPFITSPLP